MRWVIMARSFLGFFLSLGVLMLTVIACSPNSSSTTNTPNPAVIGDLGGTGARTTAIPSDPNVQWRSVDTPITSETVAQIRHIGTIRPPNPLSTTFFHTFSGDRAQLGSQLVLLNDSYLLGYDLHGGDLQFNNARQQMTFIYASPDHPELYGVTSRGDVIVLDASTGQLISEFNAHPNFADVADFAVQSGRLAIGGTDGTVFIWDAHNAELVAQFNAHSGIIKHVRLSEDGAFLMTAGDDHNTIIWDMTAQQAIHTIENGVPVTNLAISPDNQIIANSVNDTITIWELNGDQSPILRYTLDLENIGLGTVKFSPNSAYLLTGGLESDMVLWSADTGDLQAVLPSIYSARTASSFNPQNDLLAVSLITEQVRVFDLPSITEQTIQSGTLNASDRILSATFTPDGLRLLLFQTSGNIEVWGVPPQ